MKENFKKLYFITGKGGVGKTTIATSLATYIRFRSRKVIYLSLEEIESSLKDYLKDNNISYKYLDRYSSAEKYMTKRLKSELISSWIMKAPLFKTIFNIVPGFGQLIILGNIIELAMNNQDSTIVVDSPSSGHMITMLESIHTFKKVFGSGLLVKDINLIEDFVSDINQTKVIISSLPTVLAMNEGDELAISIPFISNKQVITIINNALSKSSLNKEMDMPEYLQKKIKNEEILLQKYINDEKMIFPHIPEITNREVINKLWPILDAIT